MAQTTWSQQVRMSATESRLSCTAKVNTWYDTQSLPIVLDKRLLLACAAKMRLRATGTGLSCTVKSLPIVLDKRLLFARAAMMRLRAGLSSPPPKLAPSFSLFRDASPGTLSALLARLKVRPARDTGKHWKMSLGSSRPCKQQKIRIIQLAQHPARHAYGQCFFA